MGAQGVRGFVVGAMLTAAGVSTTGTAVAAAEPCPDVEVLFARGTGEPSGVGPTGQAFVEALKSRMASPPAVYAVDYPATDQWATGVDGVRDAGARVLLTAAQCPQTQMVLGGFSQGAAVMGFVTAEQVPDGIDPTTVPRPLQPEIAEHVVAVVLFGLPNVRAMNFLQQPPVAIGPQYRSKTVELCAAEDPVCSDGMNFAAHDAYPGDAEMVDRGAEFVVGRLAAGRLAV